MTKIKFFSICGVYFIALWILGLLTFNYSGNEVDYLPGVVLTIFLMVYCLACVHSYNIWIEKHGTILNPVKNLIVAATAYFIQVIFIGLLLYTSTLGLTGYGLLFCLLAPAGSFFIIGF